MLHQPNEKQALQERHHINYFNETQKLYPGLWQMNEPFQILLVLSLLKFSLPHSCGQ